MLHFFNPGHEYALLNQSPYYTSPANIVKMQQELACIALWYAQEGDTVLGFKSLTPDILESLQQLGNKVQYITSNSIEGYKLSVQNKTVSLWGISPQAIHFFEELNKQYELSVMIPQWNNYLVDLGSRKKAFECLSFLIKKNHEIDPNVLSQTLTTLENIEELVKATPHQLLAKAPYSSSGRGLLWLPVGQLTRTERQILQGILKKQLYVSVEKALNKKLDFAMEFKVSDQIVEFLGYSLFKTNSKGAYLGNYLGKQDDITSQIEGFVSSRLLEKIKTDLIEFLSLNYLTKYEGYVGVDMLIYEEQGIFRIQPCIEINMRNNMGILAINLSQNYISSNSSGYLYIDFSSKSDIYEKHLNDTERYPLIIRDNKVLSGYLPLCPITNDNSYRAYVIIEE